MLGSILMLLGMGTPQSPPSKLQLVPLTGNHFRKFLTSKTFGLSALCSSLNQAVCALVSKTCGFSDSSLLAFVPSLSDSTFFRPSAPGPAFTERFHRFFEPTGLLGSNPSAFVPPLSDSMSFRPSALVPRSFGW